MQNLIRRNILINSKKIVYNKAFSFSTVFRNDFLRKESSLLQGDSLRHNFIRVSRYNFSSKEENKEKSEENTGNKENKENTEKDNKKTEEEEPQTEEQPQAEYKTSRKIRILLGKLIKYLFMFGGLMTLYNAYLYKKKETPTEYTGYNKDLNKLVRNIHKFWFLTYGSLTLPYHEKILPDALELVGQPSKKTLVVNLNKTLINYEYKFGSGFEILKRPGLLKFLQEMGQVYELVIFGTEDSNFVEEVCGKLDQFDMNIKYKLGKEATRLVNGEYVKDLDFLNRDLKQVICIDYNPDNVAFNPHNVVIMPEFRGDGKDRELLQSIVFLKELSKPEIKDVRKELEKYGNFRPYIKFYKSNPKYKKLLPREEFETVLDDSDLQAVRNIK